MEININRLSLFILFILSGWTISSAYFVNVEYSDGYATIANIKALLGQKLLIPIGLSPIKYFAERMPLNSILLIPAEWLKISLNLHAFDVRIHHLFFGFINTLYIYLVYTLLRFYHPNNSLAVLLAFLITIPNFIFFSYAPFISADIYPGLIFLYMLLLTQRFITQPSWPTWWWLIILGSCAPLIKHTYALFWIVIATIYGIQLLFNKHYRIALWLISGAIISAILAWLSLALALQKWDQDTPLLLLPIYQMLAISDAHPIELQSTWPWWFYFKNFAPGYGILTTILIIPGIILAIQNKDLLIKNIAIAWILAFLIAILIPFRETRYLAFLMPLTAFIIIQPIQLLLQHKRSWQIIATLLLIIDLTRSLAEATIIYNDFFSSNPIINFLQIIDDTAIHKRPIFMPHSISFSAQEYTPLYGDRLHRIFNLHPSTIARIYNHPSIIAIGMPLSGLATEYKALENPETLPINTVLLLANKFLWREPGERGYHLPDKFIQVAAVVKDVTYKKTINGYIRDELKVDSRPFVIIRQNAKLDGLLSIPLAPILTEAELKKFKFTPTDTLKIYGFRLTAMCNANKCNFFHE